MTKLTEQEYQEGVDELAGFCTNCKEVVNHGCVEQDATGYECDECKTPTVYGVEEALFEGIICIE